MMLAQQTLQVELWAKQELGGPPGHGFVEVTCDQANSALQAPTRELAARSQAGAGAARHKTAACLADTQTPLFVL